MLNNFSTVVAEMKLKLPEYLPQPFRGPCLWDLLFREHSCSLVQCSAHAHMQTLRKIMRLLSVCFVLRVLFQPFVSSRCVICPLRFRIFFLHLLSSWFNEESGVTVAVRQMKMRSSPLIFQTE